MYPSSKHLAVSTEIIKLVVPEGICDPGALTINAWSRFCIDTPKNKPCEKAYVSRIRAIVKKLPGFAFSGYQQSQFLPVLVTTMDSLAKLMMDFFKRHPVAWEQYNKTVRDKGYTHGLPKERLLVTVHPSASDIDMELIGMGIM